MNWISLVVLAVFTDSLRIFIDNYVSDVYFKKRSVVSQRLFYGFADTITAIIIILAIGFNPDSLNLSIIGPLLLSGVFSAIASIPYLKALEIDDSTNLGIFVQLAPVLYLILGWFFLDETFSPFQLVAFAVIIAAPILIVLTTRKKSRHVRIKAVFYSFMYVFIAVIGNLIFVKTNSENVNFVSSIGFLLLGKGIANAVMVWIIPKWRKRFFTVLKSSKAKVVRPMLANYFINLVKDFAYRGALVFAPAVAIASAASDSVEPIVIFFMGIVLTLIWPKFGREKLNKKTVFIHLIATVLVVIGIILIQM